MKERLQRLQKSNIVFLLQITINVALQAEIE